MKKVNELNYLLAQKPVEREQMIVLSAISKTGITGHRLLCRATFLLIQYRLANGLNCSR